MNEKLQTENKKLKADNEKLKDEIAGHERRMVLAVDSVCECGGGEQGHCCLACEVYHAYKRRETP